MRRAPADAELYFTADRGGEGTNRRILTVNSHDAGYVRDNALARNLHAHVPQAAADLIDVAMAIYYVDRCHHRDQWWTRRLPPGTIEVSAATLDAWGSVTKPLEDLLGFLTDDQWRITFSLRPETARIADIQFGLPAGHVGAPARVILFSGGLDSFAGLCSHLREAPHRDIVLAAAHTNGKLDHGQRKIIAGLPQGLRRRLTTVHVAHGLESTVRRPNESTQRTRGFVHMAFGAAIAAALNVDAVASLENGIGCFNVPYTAAQQGARMSRSVHPVTLGLMQRILQAVLGRPGLRLEIPHVYTTKAQLCRRIEPIGLGHLVENTVSCDRWPRYEACGWCTSCLLRRQALYCSGLISSTPSIASAETRYCAVVGRRGWDPQPLNAMRYQVFRLWDLLAKPDPWRALCDAFPALYRGAIELSGGDAVEDLIASRIMDLYSTYCQEWEAFLPYVTKHADQDSRRIWDAS